MFIGGVKEGKTRIKVGKDVGVDGKETLRNNQESTNKLRINAGRDGDRRPEDIKDWGERLRTVLFLYLTHLLFPFLSTSSFTLNKTEKGGMAR